LQISEKEKEIESIKDNLYKANKERDAAVASLAEKEKNIRQLDEKSNSLEPQLTAIQNELASEKERGVRVTEQLNQAMELNNSLKARLKNISTELELLRAEKKIGLTAETAEKKAFSKDTAKKDTAGYIKIRREVMP
jgi:chromosome segregation ATPase